MFLDNNKVLKNAQAYARKRGIRIIAGNGLGDGSDGAVWETNVPSAVKAHFIRKTYEVEKECYRRLRRKQVVEINGLKVPLLEEFDDELLVIEMSVVQPPFLLDFGKARLDTVGRDTYDRQRLANGYAEWRSAFGKHWEDVLLAMYILRTKFDIHYLDPRPGNIKFGDECEDDPDWDKEDGVNYEEYE